MEIKTATEFIRKNIDSCAISQITFVEVLSFDFKDENEQDEVREFLEFLDIFDTSKAIAIQCLKNRKKRKIKIPDNLIASTAQANNLTIVRGTEINNSPILLVFQLVFCVASKDTYFNMLPLMRLEYELKSCAIFVELFISVPLTRNTDDFKNLDVKILNIFETS